MPVGSLEEHLKSQIASLAAENCALQVLVAELARAVGALSPQADQGVRQCFDNATLLLEHYALTAKGRPGHFAKALQTAEQLREVVHGKEEPRAGV